MPLRDLVVDALLSLFTRGARTLFTMAGVILGLGSLVSIAGVAGSMGEHVVRSFDRYAATQVLLSAGGSAAPHVTDAALANLRSTPGVEGVAYLCQRAPEPAVNPLSGQKINVEIVGASRGGLQAVGPHVSDGVLFDDSSKLASAPVALVGVGVQHQLQLGSPSAGAGITLRGRSFGVVGVMDDTPRSSPMLNQVVIPLETMRKILGPECANVNVLITTEPMRAAEVGGVARLLLDPGHVDAWTVAVPPSPEALRRGVVANLDVLYAVVAGLSLVIGALSIGNTMSLSVMERRGEIGLRRSVGFSNRAVFGLFSVEAFVMGFLGGLVGSGLGCLAVIGIATASGWPIVISLPLTLGAPLIGGIIGLVGGLPAAASAARVSPATALRAT